MNLRACRFCNTVKEGTRVIYSCDPHYPSFLYPEDGYDPHNIEAGLCRGLYLLMVRTLHVIIALTMD